jgi:transposase
LVEQQRGQIVALRKRVRELEARLAKDSHNSCKPPSSDGLVRKTKSLRKRCGKRPGDRVGHRDETLQLVALPCLRLTRYPPRGVTETCHFMIGAVQPPLS